MNTRRNLINLACFAALAPAFAIAQTAAPASYPSRPIKLVVGFPSGQSIDGVARYFAQKLSEDLKQPVVVDNRAGASGIIAHEFVKSAEPDGYTLLITSGATMAINPALFKKLPYDPVKDFTPVILTNTTPMFLVVSAGTPVKSFPEMVAYAKQRPGKLAYGSGGSGLTQHIAMEMLKKAADIDLLHVPYKGSPAAMVATSSGETELAFAGIAGAMPLIRSNRLRPIAVTGAKRWPTLPDVPTVAESGVPGYESSNWYAMFAPLKLPPKLINLIYTEIATIAKSEEMRSRLLPDGQEPLGTTPKELEAHLAREIAKWIELGRAAGLTPN